MPAPNLGLVGAGGVVGLHKELEQMVAEQRAQEMLAYERSTKQRDFDAKQAAELAQQAHQARQAAADEERNRIFGREAETNRLEADTRARAPIKRSTIQLTVARPGGKPGEKDTVVVDEQTMEELARYRGTDTLPSGGDREDALARAIGRLGRPMTQAEEDAWQQSYTQSTTRPPAPSAAFDALVPVADPDGKVRYRLRSGAEGMEVGRVQGEDRITGEQRKTMEYYNELLSAVDDMNAVEGQLNGKDIALIQDTSLPEMIKNPLLSSAGQRYNQAVRAYALAKLRRRSGAAISAGEFKQEGLVQAVSTADTPETLAQKRATREKVLQGFARSAGPAYDEWYGHPYTPRDQAGAGGAGGVQEWERGPDGKPRPKPPPKK